MASHSESADTTPNSSLSYLHISDMLVHWPWQRRINPFYGEAAAEGDAWLRTFMALNPKSQHAFEKCAFGLISALLYPDVPADQLRTCVQFMSVYCLIDEYTDVEPAPRARKIVDICIDALRNPSKPRPDGEIIVGEVLRRFWERGQRTVSPQGGELFIASLIDWMPSIVAQAEARDRGGILASEEYRALRLVDVGILPCYALARAFLSVPDHLCNNPLHTRMMSLGCEIIAIDNIRCQDFVSYNREQASGHGDFNIITVTMHNDGLNIDDAVRLLVKRNQELTAQYLQCHEEFSIILERHGDAQEGSVMRRYLDAMGNIRRANWCWSFESGRYFGERGFAYAKTGMIPLVPPKIRDKTLRENQIDVLLMEEELAKI